MNPVRTLSVSIKAQCIAPSGASTGLHCVCGQDGVAPCRANHYVILPWRPAPALNHVAHRLSREIPRNCAKCGRKNCTHRVQSASHLTAAAILHALTGMPSDQCSDTCYAQHIQKADWSSRSRRRPCAINVCREAPVSFDCAVRQVFDSAEYDPLRQDTRCARGPDGETFP